MQKEQLIQQLNAETQYERIAAVKELKAEIDRGGIPLPVREGYTNNHVHTMYSFSPYSPSKAVWMAVMSGLSTVGIIDHDAIAGAEEFIKAGNILGIPTTIGFEMRTDWSETSLCGRCINNPDQVSNVYISAHGLPHTQINNVDAFLAPIREARAKRNQKMICKMNELMASHGITIVYEKDVLPLSYSFQGGEVTERHILFALANKMIKKYSKGQVLIDILKNDLKIELSQKQTAFLLDLRNEVYEYDLLNVLKSSFIKDIYVNADKSEAIPVIEAVSFIRSVGAIPSYCYLGNVGESATGDKKAQKFEDDYLEDLFEECKRIGFAAIAYMPSRNTKEQLARVMSLCDMYGFMQISGEDINQPRQSFICKQLMEPGFAHLIDTTWALVGHEISATENLQNGMFWNGDQLTQQAMKEKIQRYMRIGKSKS